jgi:hypothetical protein
MSRSKEDGDALRAPLPTNALAGIARRSKLPEKLSLRAASSELRSVASRTVCTLKVSWKDREVPPRAWDAFPCADGVRLEAPPAAGLPLRGEALGRHRVSLRQANC